MKARLLLVLLAVFRCLATGAQDRPAAVASSFSRNHFLLSLSYGFPVRMPHLATFGDQLQQKGAIGPLMLRAEIPVNDVIGISTMVQATQRRFNEIANYGGGSTGIYEGRGRAIGVGAMASYHFHRLIPAPKLDVYASLGVGMFIQRETLRSTGPFGGESAVSTAFFATPALAAGLRYYFLRRLAVFAEGGFTGLSYANAGLTLYLPN